MTVPVPIRLLALLNAAVLTFALVVTATGAPGPSTPDEQATLVLDGTAEIDGSDGPRRVDSGDHGLVAGERVEMLSGEAVMRLPGQGALELRAGPDGGSHVEVGAIPIVEDGDVLALAAEEELVVDAGGARLSLIDGAARISRSTGATFVVYGGRANVLSGGRTLEGGLPPLRQVVVTDTGMLPLSVSPLRFGEPPDPWDRRFLGEAIEVEATLERSSTGFSSSLREDFVPDVFFYQAVLPGLLRQTAFDQALLNEQERPVGETLVGAAVALVGRRGDFATRWDEVFDLRTDGAGWGVVAADQDAPRAALLAALDGAVARSPLLFSPPSTEEVFQPRPLPVRRPLAPLPPLAPPVVRPIPPGPASPTRPPPPPSPTSGPAPTDDDDGLLEPVVDPLAELLDGVLDGLGGVTDSLL